jgi:predicted RNA-binding Zn ribbon-like protein
MQHTAVRDLPDDLALPLTSGAPWWYWLGARPALDFVNTHRERWRRSVETLVTPADLALWLEQAELVDGPVPVSDELRSEALELREAIDACVRAVIDGAAPAPEAVACIDGWLDAAAERPALRVEDGVMVLGVRAGEDPARRAIAAIALDAAAMVGRAEERSRVRVCGSETCSARFYDRSPAGRRRWCSMQTCGNAAKARRHRARRRESGSYAVAS